MIKRPGGIPALFAVIGIILLLPGCSGVEPESRSELLLGTACTITLYEGLSDEAFEAAFARIRQIEHNMSVHLPDSEVSELNRSAGSGRPVALSADTFTVLEEALKIAALSSGAFDPAVGPLVELWGIGTDDARLPEPEEIEAALPLVDYRRVETNPEDLAVSLPERGMKINLGGIAKGYAADRAAETLKEHGVTGAIINLGGNVLTVGEKPDGSPWKIGIQDPASDRGDYVLTLELTEMSVVTSGPYERFFIGPDGRRYHHILDTTTGYPVESELTSVTIVTSESLLADALSTTVFALGRERGMGFIENYEGVEGVFITAGKEIYLTSGLADQSIPNRLTDTSYTIIR